MKFREHNGLLDDSMQTVVELPDGAALLQHLQNLLAPWDFPVTPETLHVTHYAYDARIHWDTYVVTLDKYGVLGFTNCPVPEFI
jgi:hypothetical protein